MVKDGTLTPCEFITVESEFAAMSAAIGASAAGARTYTATASQGLLYMAEALFNAAGLGLPIVMTVANRAIGAPINIWNDQSDCDEPTRLRLDPALRGGQPGRGRTTRHRVPAGRGAVAAGHGVRRRLRAHARRRADRSAHGRARSIASCPAYRPRQLLDPDEPVTIGAMVGPEAFTEVRYLAHHQLNRAVDRFAELAADFAAITGQQTPSTVSAYRTEGARTVVVALGSVTGTVKDTIDEYGDPVGLATLTLYRPFPAAEVREVLAGADHVIVLERAFAPGAGGIVSADVRTALAGTSTADQHRRRRARWPRRHEGVAFRHARRRPLRPAARPELPRSAYGRRRPRDRATRRLMRDAHRPSPSTQHGSDEVTGDDKPEREVLPGRQPGGRQSAAADRICAPSRPSPIDATRSTPGTAPARAVARRWRPATCWTPRTARPRDGWSPSTPPDVSRSSPRRTRKARGSCRGCIRCSPTPPRSPPAWPRPLRTTGQ